MPVGCAQLLVWLWLLRVGGWAQEDPTEAARSTLGLNAPGATAVCEHRQYPQVECLAGHLLWGTCETQRDPRTQDDDPGACDYVCGYCLRPCPVDTELLPEHLQRLADGTDWSFDCLLCAAGKLDHDFDPFTPCSECPAGTHKDEGEGACEPCDMYSVDDDLDPATPCVLCPAGQKRVSSVQCDPCAAGKYMASQHDSSCLSCPSGSFSERAATSCTPCPAGTADLDSDPATPCRTCPAGDYADAGQFECSACDSFPTREVRDHDNNYVTPKLCLPINLPEPEPELVDESPAPPPSPPGPPPDDDSTSTPGDGLDNAPGAPIEPVLEPEPNLEPTLQPEELESTEAQPVAGNDTGVEDLAMGTDTGSTNQPEQQGSGSWGEEEMSPTTAVEQMSPATDAEALLSGAMQGILGATAGSLLCMCTAVLSRRGWQQHKKVSKVYAISGHSSAHVVADTGTDTGSATPARVMRVPDAGSGADPNDLLPSWMESGIDVDEIEKGPLPLIARLSSSPRSPTSGRGSPLAFLSTSFGRSQAVGSDGGSPRTPTSASPLSPHNVGISRREQARLDREAAAVRAKEAEAYRKALEGRKAAMLLYGPEAAKMWTPSRTRNGKKIAHILKNNNKH
eukprot:COSAG02_NODE_3145_length_7289_cov_10.121280_3_plen_624_part_00